ncbi:MAG: tetratricopeptide repeat protein [Treponema sp.]|jgi:tetratricopeptide (TPR) repeat protein|nr:tetratricopeptide repeat protein [Treponema sp.]
MKQIKELALGVLVVLVIGTAMLWVYRHEKSKAHANLAKRIAELSPRGGPPETIDGLKAAIAAYEAQIELNIKEGAQTGAYWKILAIRLADKGMHRDALDAFERALHFNIDDPTLYYLTAESASAVAASVLGFSGNSVTEKNHFSKLAESSYLKSVELDGNYAKPRIGLGILYAFELNRPEEAIPHMERYLQLAPNDVKGMFVLARAYYMTESYDNAVELYDRIISKTRDPKVKAEAQNNKEIIRDLIYG